MTDRTVTSEDEVKPLQTDNPSAPDYDWQKDREWFNQRLANARLRNSSLHNRLVEMRKALRDIASGSPGHRSLARTALSKDDEAAKCEDQKS